jgi:hypothetical protein
MGFFDRFRKKPPEPASEPEPPPEPDPPPDHLVLVREGMSTPTDEDMLAVLREAAPELLAVPRRGLSQPRWWRQDDWVSSGMRGVGSALAAELGIDPDKTTWSIVKDDKGARIGIVMLRR